MLGRTIRVGVAVAAVGLGAWLGAGTTAASAAAQRPNTVAIDQSAVVLSDTITFSGVAIPTVVGGYSFTSQQCALTSDGENVIFPCTVTLQFSLTTLRGTAMSTSADGVIKWAFTLVPTGAVGHYAMTGDCAVAANSCTETETENGVTVTNLIAAVTGTLTATPIAGTADLMVTGQVMIFESPTAP